MSDSIVQPFPTPGPQIREALAILDIVVGGDPETIAMLGDLEDLPRPWDPSTCPARLRLQIWSWCAQVASWINSQYIWRPAAMIPACWPAHTHLAIELPALACQRLAAQEAFDVSALEEWQRYTLPTFLDRMNGRLGESGCKDGRHVDWPGAARHVTHVREDEARRRLDWFLDDTGL